MHNQIENLEAEKRNPQEQRLEKQNKISTK